MAYKHKVSDWLQRRIGRWAGFDVSKRDGVWISAQELYCCYCAEARCKPENLVSQTAFGKELSALRIEKKRTAEGIFYYVHRDYYR